MDGEQVQQLLANDSKEPIDIRDRAILELMYSSGLRLSELQGLDLNSINTRVREVRVIGKGNKRASSAVWALCFACYSRMVKSAGII